MLQTEYIRNLNCNYQRILLDEKPEENRYQYCMINRGGIRGLLSCSLRYLNGLAYLYFDITSTQNVAQIFSGKTINRSWMKDFLWSMQQVHLELSRFLLDDRNVLWHPEQIFQDVEKNDFSFMYIPYYNGDNGFLNLVDFWVEHIDYEDEVLVEYIYKMHEQFEFLGSVYLQEQIFEDARVLDKIPQVIAFDPDQDEIHSIKETETQMPGNHNEKKTTNSCKTELENNFRINSISAKKVKTEQYMETGDYREDGKNQENSREENQEILYEESKVNRRGIFYMLEGKRRRQKENKEKYRKDIKQRMEGLAVSEETKYQDALSDEDFGKTIYIEETQEKREITHALYNKEGNKAAEISKTPFIIGKKKEEADLVLEDTSISRIHARILRENDIVYIEDMNSTNGTFKNGLRMQPYEKKPLEKEDEIKFGKKIYYFR